MKLRVATWNAEGMFVEGSMTRRATPHDALQVLRTLDADCVVVPEFGKIRKLDTAIEISIRALGYEIKTLTYADSRAKGSGLAMLSRLPIVEDRVVRMESIKGALELVCQLPNGKLLRIIGAHLDDRTEILRQHEITAITTHLSHARSLPTLLMGDFNAMSRHASFAKFAKSRVVRLLARTLGTRSQLSSVVWRVREMADGSTVKHIENETNLVNLDPKLRPTISAKQRGLEYLPSLRLAKIDWIFASPDISVITHRVLKDVGSDHRPVVAVVDIA